MARKKKAAPTVEQATVEVAVPADRLYDLVSDISKMGRLSPECTGGKWLKGADGPSVGATFKGRNKRGPVRWSTTNRVVAANRGKEFAFETQQSGTRWSYRFEPAGDTTIVTESREAFRKRPLVARVFTKFLLGGVKEHDEEMNQSLRVSLDRLKAVAEAPAEEKSRRRSRKRPNPS